MDDYATLKDRHAIINSTIEEFTTGVPHDEPMVIAGSTRQAIDRCFSHDSVDEILKALEAEAEAATETSSWAKATLKTLHERSPTSVRVTLRLLRLGRRWGISEAFQREYLLAGKFMNHSDFTEGVTARLINKPATTPEWNPATLAETSDALVDEFFKMEDGARLPLLNPSAEHDYKWYPYGYLALPREADVEHAVRQGDKSRAQVVRWFEEQRNGKMGVREKVEEVLARRTKVDGKKCTWIAEE